MVKKARNGASRVFYLWVKEISQQLRICWSDASGASRQGEVGVWGSSAAWPRPTSAPHPPGRATLPPMTRTVCAPSRRHPHTSYLHYVRRMCFADSAVVSNVLRLWNLRLTITYLTRIYKNGRGFIVIIPFSSFFVRPFNLFLFVVKF